MLRIVTRWAALMPLTVAGCLPTVLHGQRALSHASSVRVERTRAEPVRIVVSIEERMLFVLSGTDTLRTAAIAVASGRELVMGKKTWRFETPRGRRTVRAKKTDPVWRPPDWHYAEAALEQGLKLKPLPAAGLSLADGRRVQLRAGRVSIQLDRSGTWFAMPSDEHIIFGETLYIPPLGSRNREVRGELGAFALDLGDGYLVHGTPDQGSVGSAVTHGCFRLLDEDMAWLFEHVPVGTSVLIR